jgi:GNAT superfamily N-acetyltransferase
MTAAGRGEIDSMFVEPEWRGRGIGRDLVTRALAWLDVQGATARAVAVATDNAAAWVFYERLGFVPRTVHMEHRPKRH